ncbi:uncharacterized protein LOC128217439 [Mya arenaria]|uniref:uncharacterized protein LOC128217439 n=1 Tax=Mya arenaria TaxID=6604 RepID=UPI0022E15F4B|nr:uncharacterized protein LOC128217439 [Mya arenaria]
MEMIQKSQIIEYHELLTSPNGTVLELEGYDAFDVEGIDGVQTSVHITVPLLLNDSLVRELCGSIHMKVAASARLGSLCRPSINTTYTDGNTNSSDVLLGEYVFLELPELEVFPGNPSNLDMKERSRLTSRIHFRSGTLGPSLYKVYMPNNVTITPDAVNMYEEEPFLTATDFQLVGRGGLDDSSDAAIGVVEALYESNSRSSESDEILYNIPELILDLRDFENDVSQVSVQSDTGNNTAFAELDFLLEVESLDFVGAYEEEAMMVCYVLDTRTGFLLVRNTTLTVNRTRGSGRSLEPSLNFSIEFEEEFKATRTCGPKMQFLATIWHENASWSSAYDVSLVLYLPPQLHDVSVSRPRDFIKRNNRAAVTLDRQTVVLELLRVSFAHRPRIYINLTVDHDSPAFRAGRPFPVHADLVYNGWREVQDRGFMQSVVVTHGNAAVLGDVTSDELEPACKCSDDRTCARDVTAVCAGCTKQWKCIKTLADFGEPTALIDATNARIFYCSNTTRERYKGHGGNCFAEIRLGQNVTRRALSPILGTLVGLQTSTGHVFGISSNGLAYMTSRDFGVTWFSVSPGFVTSAMKRRDFIKAVVVDVNQLTAYLYRET